MRSAGFGRNRPQPDLLTVRGERGGPAGGMSADSRLPATVLPDCPAAEEVGIGESIYPLHFRSIMQ